MGADPKTYGDGVGIIKTSLMNKCLIMKWWWRIHHDSPQVLWFKLLKAKYFPDMDPINVNPRRVGEGPNSGNLW